MVEFIDNLTVGHCSSVNHVVNSLFERQLIVGTHIGVERHAYAVARGKLNLTKLTVLGLRGHGIQQIHHLKPNQNLGQSRLETV
jgi:hypothetical protein